MSTTPRRSLARALLELADFEAQMIPAVTCERWTVAGSVRRQKADVGDVDIVCIPRFADLPGNDMFATPTRTNLLWQRVDDLVRLGKFSRHARDTVLGERECWGDKTRSIEFRGCAYEIYVADKDNFGPLLAIRTGPAELGKELVTRIPRFGYACRDGFHLWDVKASPAVMRKDVTEDQFFKAAGMVFMPPEQR